LADGRKRLGEYTWAETIQEAYRMNKRISKIVDLIFKAIALAMGVVVVVTNLMGIMDTKGRVLLLGIGLFCLAITTFEKE
jgi:energy-converting hydrogenase Eha subunit A